MFRAIRQIGAYFQCFMTVNVGIHLLPCDSRFVEVNNPISDVEAMNEEGDYIIVVGFLVMT